MSRTELELLPNVAASLALPQTAGTLISTAGIVLFPLSLLVLLVGLAMDARIMAFGSSLDVLSGLLFLVGNQLISIESSAYYGRPVDVLEAGVGPYLGVIAGFIGAIGYYYTRSISKQASTASAV